MKNTILVLIILISVLVTLHVAQANVGVGMSPSKINEVLVGGEEKKFDILAFNPGDEPLKISFHAEGEIAPYMTFSKEDINIDPEPQPHAQPIKNGQTVTVTMKAPAVRETTTITGMIVASGGPGENAQFGGTVGVATQVIYTITPPTSVLAFITKQHVIIASTIIVIVLMLVILKKKGMKLTFEKQE